MNNRLKLTYLTVSKFKMGIFRYGILQTNKVKILKIGILKRKSLEKMKKNIIFD